MSPGPNINLLASRKKESLKEINRRNKIRSAIAIALVGYLIVLVPVILYRIYITVRHNSINKQIQAKTQELNSKISLETKYVLVSNKLGIITGVLEDRLATRETLTDIYNLFPQNTTLTAISFGDKDQMSVSGEASDVFSFSLLMDQIEAYISQRFDNVTLDGANRQEDGSYGFSTTIDLSGLKKS